MIYYNLDAMFNNHLIILWQNKFITTNYFLAHQKRVIYGASCFTWDFSIGGWLSPWTSILTSTGYDYSILPNTSISTLHRRSCTEWENVHPCKIPYPQGYDSTTIPNRGSLGDAAYLADLMSPIQVKPRECGLTSPLIIHSQCINDPVKGPGRDCVLFVYYQPDPSSASSWYGFWTFSKYQKTVSYLPLQDTLLSLNSVYSDFSFFNAVSINSSKSLHILFVFLLFHSISVVFFITTNNLNYNNFSFFFLFFLVFLNSLLFLLSKNLFFFVIFYEGAIFPIFLILKNYGNYFKRNQAAYFILIWALIGSIFLFLGLIFFYMNTNSWNNSFYFFSGNSFLTYSIFFFLVGFAVKVPMWPFHYWIARAHAEGPTNLSIFLSGVLVKLSVYGMLKVLELFHFKSFFNIFFFCAILGVIEATLKMLIQVDSKVVVAFSTTVQMNFILFLIFSKNVLSENALKIGLLNHLLTASILFFICDLVLIRFNSREFFFISGLYSKLPIFSIFLLFSLINQINFPGFLGFLLDVSFLYSSALSLTSSSFILFFFLFVIEHLYILFFFLKICFGVSVTSKRTLIFDLNFFEVVVFLYLFYFSIFFGIFPAELSWKLFI